MGRRKEPTYLLPPAALRRAAQRAFISWERRRRPAAVMPPLRLFPARGWLACLPPRCLAQRARAAADSFARVAADILRLPRRPRPVERGAPAPPPPTSEFKRLSKLSICRRMETASSKFLRVKSISCV
jgi:hypothetical protein